MTLLDEKIPQITADFSDGKQWGNDTDQARVTSLWSFAKAQFGAKTDKVVLYAASMGALSVLNWARANSGSVAAVALLIPALDLADLHDNNRGGYAAEIETVYQGLPIKIWYSATDPIAIPGAVTAFVAASGAQTQGMGNIGHTVDGSYAPCVASFLRAAA